MTMGELESKAKSSEDLQELKEAVVKIAERVDFILENLK